MKIAALQSNIVWEDQAANFARLESWLAVAAAADVRLVVLPEMFACGFSMQTERVQERSDGVSIGFLKAQAARHGFWICGSLPELTDAQRPANTLVVASPTGQLWRYKKLHLFTLAGEDQHYQAGNERLTLEIEGVRVSPFICYDLRFADEFWALAADTDCYVVVANWPHTRREHWRTLLRARAIENQAYVVGVNRVGEGNGLSYAGDSAVIDPLGHTLAEASDLETLLISEVDVARVRKVRRELPFLADRHRR